MCGKKLRNLLLLSLVLLLLFLPLSLQADVKLTDAEFNELMTLIQESKAKEKKANETIQTLQTELKSWQEKQKAISKSQARDLAELNKYLKKLKSGLNLGIDAGILAVPGENSKLQLGFYAGIALQFQ